MATIQLTNNDIKAFPSMENLGWGENTTGGRGKPVYFVTNLNDSGSGSLRQAISNIEFGGNNGGNIIFRVSGILSLNSILYLNNGASNISIYGQSAPTGGFTVHDQETNFLADNVLVQHVKFRGGDGGSSRQTVRISSTNQNRVRQFYMFDHCSFTWGGNSGNFGINTNATDLNNVLSHLTLRKSIMGEGFNFKNSLFYGRGISKCSALNNFYVNSSERNMRSSIGTDNSYEFKDNYIYGHEYGLQLTVENRVDIEGNVWEDGWQSQKSSSTIEVLNCSTDNCPPSGKTNNSLTQLYLVDNIFNGNNAPLNSNAASAAVNTPIDPSNYASIGSSLVKNYVLNNAGARVGLEGLDSVDNHLKQDAINGTGNYATSESQTVGLPTINPSNPYTDSSGNGLSDEYELNNGGNINQEDRPEIAVLSDGTIVNQSNVTNYSNEGYTHLEIFMADLVGSWDNFPRVELPNLNINLQKKKASQAILLSQ